MARTKGAKDKSRRKQPIKAVVIWPESKPAESGPPAPAIDRPALAADDFTAAIAAELGQTSHVTAEAGPATGSATCSPPAPPAFDPGGLTLDGLASAWQLPFYALGVALAWLRIIPDPEPIQAVGRRRALDLARPSYAIYEHYTREYLGLHPDNSVHVAAGVTALNLVGILPDLIDAVVAARQKAAPAPATEGA